MNAFPADGVRRLLFFVEDRLAQLRWTREDLAAAGGPHPSTLYKAAEREGQPISAQFEIDDGKLRLSIYTNKGEDFTEVITDPTSGAIVTAEKIIDSDDLSDAADQKAAMEKATVSLLAAAVTAEKDNPGSRAVGIFPDLRDGHAVAEVTLLQGESAKKVTEKLD